MLIFNKSLFEAKSIHFKLFLLYSLILIYWGIISLPDFINYYSTNLNGINSGNSKLIVYNKSVYNSSFINTLKHISNRKSTSDQNYY